MNDTRLASHVITVLFFSLRCRFLLVRIKRPDPVVFSWWHSTAVVGEQRDVCAHRHRPAALAPPRLLLPAAQQQHGGRILDYWYNRVLMIVVIFHFIYLRHICTTVPSRLMFQFQFSSRLKLDVGLITLCLPKSVRLYSMLYDGCMPSQSLIVVKYKFSM